MPGESLSFDITARDNASSKFRDVGRSAADASVKMDLAAASLKVFSDSSIKAGKAANTSAAALKSHVAADKLYADAMRVASGETTKFTKLIHSMPGDLDKAAASTSKLGDAAGAAGGTGGLAGGGMGALVAAGVVLSPVLASLTVGAAGFAAAAYGIIKPIENAAQATGGLQKNMHTLDAEQQTVAKGILGLGKEYDAFQRALKPTVLHDFNAGLQLAGHLLHDVQPVAVAFGKAFGGFLGQLDKMFGSGEWQAFFSFMSRTVGPDLKLVGGLFINLANDLPPLLVALQPVASALIKTADAVALTANAAEKLSGGPLTAMEQFGRSTQSIKDSATGVSGFNQVLDVLIGPQSTHSVDNFFHTLHEGFNILTGAEKGALKPTHDNVTALGQWKTITEQVVVQSGRLGRETDITNVKEKVFAGTTQSVIKGLMAQAHQLNVTAAGYEHALGPLGNYISAQITERNDLVTLNQDLKKSHDAIGLKTQAERNSFQTAQQYISDTVKQGNAALAAHQGIDAQIRSIENALPRLESVKGKTAAYKQELDLLKGILDKLRAERLIQEQVRVTGSGSWSYRQSGVGHAVSATGAAAGAYVTGGVAGRDSVPIMAMPGEVVVPTKMVSAGAVDHLRGSIPGFAAGGIVPSYGGSPGGLGPWTSHNQHATVTAITTSIAKAFASSFASSLGGLGSGGAGVQRWAPLVLQVLGLLRQPRQDLGIVLSQMNTESGGNPNAINLWDSNAAAGDPSRGLMQVIGSTFNAYAGPFRGLGIYNPLANVYAGLNYAIHRYGSSWTSVLGHGHGYDSGGFLPTGLSLAYNGTGRPEQVLSPRQSGGGTVNINVHVSADASMHPAETGRIIADRLKAHVKRGGTLYPAGVTPR